jgi:signal transduction histidine kinase
MAAEAGGFGLFSIRERMEQLGGELQIVSEPGGGSRMTIIAPLKREETDEGAQSEH